MPTLFSNKGRLYFEVKGDGPPLVLIPGFAAGAWIWRRQIEPLSAKFKIITFDHRGVGQSDYIDRPAEMRLVADDVAELLRELGIGKAHVVGASFGGFVAQEFALAYPKMTNSLVLCCTSFGGPKHLAPALETLTALISTDGFNTEDRVRRNLAPAFEPEFLETHPHVVAEMVKLRLANPVDENAHRWQMTAAVAFDAEARVTQIQARTLVISGREDAVVPAQNSRNLVARIAGAELKIIDGGHLFFIEQADEFNQIVMQFAEGVVTT